MKMEYKNILPHFNNISQYSRSILRYFTDKNKIILLASLIILLSSLNILPTSALSYQSTSKVEFNINPTVSITINGGDLSIPSLAPGDSKDSNIITVTASSNAMNGYSLSSTVGDSTNASTELRKGGTDTTYKFTNLTTNKPSLSDFDSNTNTWGYSYCNTSSDCTNNTNWISGDITITDPTSPLYPTTGYNGLPIYTTTSPITLINSPTSATSTIEFKIGARSTTTLVAGEYTNIINFISVANPNPTYITLDGATYMQDNFSCVATPVGTVKKLIDNRDEQEYLVARAMDGNCWMIENLKIGKTLDSTTNTSITLTPTDSNVTDSFTMNYTDIPTDGKFHAYTIDDVPYQNNSNEWICRGGEDDWDSCYYNWFTATAGSGTSYVTTGNVETSICPAGWTLPTSPQFRPLYSQYYSFALMLVDNPTTTKNNFAGKIPGFLLSGDYTTGGAENYANGGYWSRTPYNAITNEAFILSFHHSMVEVGSHYRKYIGYAVRCLKSS